MAARLHDAVRCLRHQRPPGHRGHQCTRPRSFRTDVQQRNHGRTRPSQLRPVLLPRPLLPPLRHRLGRRRQHHYRPVARRSRALPERQGTARAHRRTFHREHRVPRPMGRPQRAHPQRGVKSFHHPDAGLLELTYQPLDLPISTREAHSLTIYTAKPGTPDEDRLKLLASWAVTPAEPQGPSADQAARPDTNADMRGPSQ
ncbi:hypothetical protein [Streptomyces sp. NBC_00154]|uniref:MmyB family transcriptional regulator n=1 Tax=Streptomyces sp. NBC_00154 TaxID=2975670 RepID=UPI00225C2A60|nr:hypothetical protein [Streptomyces sp. NBC_00154]MCX5317393.1 hypothetical protein [Streptomyces sp. NBC_00154]